jgi:3-oxoacyl-[acyl-carrier-protein] synthase-3
VASSLMETMGYRNVLVAHSEVLSVIQDPRQFLMQAIFADGAGAVVLQKCDQEEGGILAIETFTDATNCEWLRAGGGSLSLATPETLEDGSYFLKIDTAAIFPFAIEKMASSLRSGVMKAGRSLSDVDWVIAHQTGINIAHGVADAVGIDIARFLMTLEHTGNTSGGTIPIALDHFNRQGVLAEGDLIVMPAVGAGMSWGSVSCSWTETNAGRRARSLLQAPKLGVVDTLLPLSIRQPERTGELIVQ